MDIFLEISLITAIVSIISLLIKFARQPFIVGYILAGIVIGPTGFNILHSTDNLEFLSKLGITILLYIVGLNLNPKVLKEIGKIAIVTGTGQVLFTSLIGYFLCILLGFNSISSLYISIALTFSSTIIILKLLTDKGDINALYGRISIGFLLVQDLIATLILIAITTFSQSHGLPLQQIVFGLLVKSVGLGIFYWIFSKYIVPKIIGFIAQNQELLFLLSIGWGLTTASIFHLLGFSIEIGALVAGISLSSFVYATEIASRLKPLRDFFIILFFILLGSQMKIGIISQILLPSIYLSLFVLIGNPLIVFLLMNLLGFKRKTSFLAGLTVAQISEFSLILGSLGFTLGHINNEALSLITLVGLFTISGSTYLILYADTIFKTIEPFLKYFEIKKVITETKFIKDNPPEIILFGLDKSGNQYLDIIQNLGLNYLVVDHNPEVIHTLQQKGLPFAYGDADDTDFLDEIGLSQSKLVVSTIPSHETNKVIITKLKHDQSPAISVFISHFINNTLDLYKSGADYVIVPIYFGSRYLSHLLKNGLDRQILDTERTRHLLDLQKQVS